MGLFNKIKENVKQSLTNKQMELQERKMFQAELKEDVKKARRDAIKKEALIQARKTGKNIARENFGPRKKVSSANAFNGGLDVMDFGGMGMNAPKRKKSKKRNQTDIFDGLL